MKQTKTDNQKEELKGWTSHGNSMSQEEFIAGIQAAEEGPFFTVQESMENFEQWLNSREKK